MSSLDHIHRRAVAARLVEEAAHRQVIVFTHDLAFLFELRRETEAMTAKGKGKKIQYQTIRRRESAPGYVEGDLPNKAKSALGFPHLIYGTDYQVDGLPTSMTGANSGKRKARHIDVASPSPWTVIGFPACTVQ